MDTLVLTNTYLPIGRVSWQRAITWVLTGRVQVLEEYEDRQIHSVHEVFPVPSVVRFVQAVTGVFRKGMKFNRKNIWLRDKGTCFAAGTQILMVDGSQRAIEQVVPGDAVIDAFGDIQTVTHVGVRSASNVVRLKCRGSAVPVDVTSDHPFLTPTGRFVPIRDLPKYLVFPRTVVYRPRPVYPFDTAGFLSQGRTVSVRDGKVCYLHSRADVGIPTALSPSPDLAYFLGLFCAEGTAAHSKAGQGRVSFALHVKEEHTLAADVIRIARDCLGVGAKVVYRKHSNGLVVRLRGSALGKILVHMVKQKEQKRIPWDLIGPYHTDFLRGLFRGDSSLNRTHHQVSLYLIAEDLIHGAQSMLWGLGIYPTVQVIRREGRKPVYGLVLSARNYTRFLSMVYGEAVDSESGEAIFGDDRFVFRKVKSLTPVSGTFAVYNLEVTETHSYIANGLAVHNCQYCGQKVPMAEFTFDHVVPRQRGGATRWENIVVSCPPCNQRKGHRLLEECRMRLRAQPVRPKSLPGMAFPTLTWGEGLPETWKDYLGSFQYWNTKLDEGPA